MTANNNTTTSTSPPAKRVKFTERQIDTITTSKTMAAPPLLIKKLSEKARLPTRGSAFSAGYDIYASKATIIPAHGKGLVDTDISMACPAGTYGRIAPRSGLASKHFIDTGAGVIDADYRGQVKILLFNHSETDFAVSEGDRVAQLVLERIYTPEVLEVAELEDSVRGAGGFGSTGGFSGQTLTATISFDGASDATPAPAAEAAKVEAGTRAAAAHGAKAKEDVEMKTGENGQKPSS
ncbi:unnamed protein product [Discula destructiva]